MGPRPIDEAHRAATPLELLFDLVFVVAIARLAVELAHAVAEDHVADGVVAYGMVFFAIWWAWMNFTWFASAYDNDDVPYRLLTMLQMGGVLILAAGVPAAFDATNFAAVTLGYLVMRVALVAQWLRAAAGDPQRRATALTYAAGITLVQVGWLLRLLLPDGLAMAGFAVLVVAELAVPFVAERHGMTPWHPHHIAERYGLFTIIVLGECVLAATVAVQSSLAESGVSGSLVVVAGSALAILFALWWVYFLKPAGRGLEQARHLSFWWGYGHYLVFASLAALGAGMEVLVETLDHHVEVADTTVAFAVALPVAVFLVLVWALHVPLGATSPASGILFGSTAVAVLVLAALTGAGLPLTWAIALFVVPLVGLVAAGVVHDHRGPPGG